MGVTQTTGISRLSSLKENIIQIVLHVYIMCALYKLQLFYLERFGLVGNSALNRSTYVCVYKKQR